MNFIQELINHPSRGGCGVGALADLKGRSRELIDWALAGLANMEHRGGAIDDTGDGAGLLFTIDPAFFARFIAHGKHLPADEQLSVGVVFFPVGESPLSAWQSEIDGILRREGLTPLGWRRVPIDESALGRSARESRRDIWQVLIGEGLVPKKKLALAMWQAKHRIETSMRDVYLPSFSPKTLIYKGLCTGQQLPAFYPDLKDPALTTDAVIFHRRYSTNTFSNWYLAQPFRLLGHNGEINAVKANRDAVRNLEGEVHISNVLMKQGSDSADLDRVVELFNVHGVPLLEALVRVMPPAQRDMPGLDPKAARYLEGAKRALGALGAWEGPAGIVATDGDFVVARLDRMGLRPLRYILTRSGKLVVESEVGAVPVASEDVAEIGQLDPGEAIAVDLEQRRLLRQPEILEEVLKHTPLNYSELSSTKLAHPVSAGEPASGKACAPTLATFGWSHERVRALKHMAQNGSEPISSMGHDKPLAVLSKSSPTLFKYFKQIIAVVTNPPIDPIREGTAMDLSVFLGRTPRAYEDSNEYRVFPQVRFDSPILTEGEVRGIIQGGRGMPDSVVFDATYPKYGGAKALSDRIADLTAEAVRLARNRSAAVIVLSDRQAVADAEQRLAVPAVLIAGALHSALTQQGKRRRLSLLCESGEVQEPHDAAVLIANGADAVCPWVAFDLAFDVQGADGVTKLKKAFDRGLERIMSKMGICSLDGYRGSKMFEAVGLSPAVVDFYLPGTVSRVGGVELAGIDADIRRRAELAGNPAAGRVEEDHGIYRKELLRQLYLVSRGTDPTAWRGFLEVVGKHPQVYLRDLLSFRKEQARPIPPESVISPEEIVAAILRGAAISHGALHRIAHRAISGALNELNSSSNCGEGGEDKRRNKGGAWEKDRSRIRQVASGRFGVDTEYLVNADDLQIKIGQGAKPGEGGHLPAEKVTAEIAAIRHCPPGVGLISPPPQHDIYSIEDLAQLIHNLRAVNPGARISVKCPSVTDLGTIAVGVAKAGADIIDISGFEGGTGAAAASSIEHAGLPLERGLAEAHQALLLNGIRGEVRLRADGGIKTGDDVLKLLALGADEVSLGTALMAAEFCTYCHSCMKGTCPSGITTQDPEVFKRFTGGHGPAKLELAPDLDEETRYQTAKQGVKNYLLTLAADVRGKLAALGMRHPRELVGRVDLLDQLTTKDARLDQVDLSNLLLDPRQFARAPAGLGARCSGRKLPPTALNFRIVDEVRRAIDDEKVELRYEVRNTDRAVGATLSGALAAGTLPKPKQPIKLLLNGHAGQGLGFALYEGIHIELDGLANDGVAESMSGGRLVVRQPRECRRTGNSVAGNAAGYGAVAGEIFLEGKAGQRLGVRNSGATIVCEGAGKYAFEYMTHGVAVVLGPVGPVFASGMQGGTIFVHDPQGEARRRMHADAAATPLLPLEKEQLRALVEKHAELTGSPVAQGMLSNWERALEEFVAVRPVAQAQRVMAQVGLAKAAG